MAVTKTMGYQFLEEEANGEHALDGEADLVAILLPSTFTFDPAVHSTYDATVKAAEIAEANGYVKGDQAGRKKLTNVTVTETATGATVGCDNVTWTASGGSIATCSQCIIFNNTHANDTVICCINFGASYSTTVGTLLQIDFTNGLFSKSNA